MWFTLPGQDHIARNVYTEMFQSSATCSFQPVESLKEGFCFLAARGLIKIYVLLNIAAWIQIKSYLYIRFILFNKIYRLRLPRFLANICVFLFFRNSIIIRNKKPDEDWTLLIMKSYFWWWIVWFLEFVLQLIYC